MYGFLTRCRKSQAQLPTTLHLQSSSTLGTGKVSTNKERLDKLEDKEIRRALEGRAGKRKRGEDRFDILHVDDADDDDDDGSEVWGDLEMGREGKPEQQATVDAPKAVEVDFESTSQHMTSEPSVVGSALRRNLDGSVTAPRIATKSKQGQKVDIACLEYDYC
jgi:ATP-dependent RNA helicase DHX37/DHR1